MPSNKATTTPPTSVDYPDLGLPSMMQIPLGQLRPHPHNEEIYGSIEVDEVLADSLRRNGQLQPLVVVPWTDRGYPLPVFRVISGHRRLAAMESIGFKYADCHVVEFANEAEELTALVESNAQREKTYGVKLREALIVMRYQETCQTEDEKRKSIYTNDLADLQQDDTSIGPQGPNDDDITEQNERNLVARCSVSRTMYKRVVAVFSDRYRDHVVAEVLEGHKSPAAAKKKLIATWDQIREQVLAGEYGLNPAADEIRQLRRNSSAPNAKTDAKSKSQAKAKPAKAPKKPSALESVVAPMDELVEVLDQMVFDERDNRYFGFTLEGGKSPCNSDEFAEAAKQLANMLHRFFGEKVFALIQ